MSRSKPAPVAWMAARDAVVSVLRSVFLTGACLGALAGCQKEPDVTAFPASPPGLEASWAFDDCAPWDGAATTIYLAADMPDNPLTEARYPHAWVSIYQPSSDVAGGSYRWDAGEMNVGGATWCEAEDRCTGGGVGEVRIGGLSGDRRALVGTVNLRFPNGVHIEGGFGATWIPREPICG